MVELVNDHLVLVVGKSKAGKSASLMSMTNPSGVMYLNCESGKRLPFKSGFSEYTIIDPLQVVEAIQAAEGRDDIHTVVVDSLTYMMDMFESLYIYNAKDTMKGWMDYQQFFKNLMQTTVAGSSKSIVFTAHVKDQLNESEMVMETLVPIKGALKANGVESYFSCIVGAKKVKTSVLTPYKSDLLVITPEEEALEFKHVFQTKLTKDTVNERINGPIGMWKTSETYIDNSVQKVLDHLNDYYR